MLGSLHHNSMQGREGSLCLSKCEVSAATRVAIAYLKPNTVLHSLEETKEGCRASSFKRTYDLVGKKGLGHSISKANSTY